MLIFYLEFIYTSCTTYSLCLVFRSLAQSTSYARGLINYSLRCARGLLRPPSTFMFPTTLGDWSTSLYAMLEDCADHRACLRSQPRSGTCRLVSTLCLKTADHQARLHSHPRSGTCPPVPTSCSGTIPTTEHVYIPNHAWGLVNHSLRCSRGLLRSLSDHSLGTALITYI